MKKFEVLGHEPSLLPDGFEFELAWADEFDGDTLDTSKWDFRRHLFHKSHDAWIGEEGLEFRDGNLIFKQVQKDGKYYSCQLQTGENWYDRPGDNPDWDVAEFKEPKFLHKFGYYECRCKLQRGNNWWSAFWLQSPNIGTHPDEKRAGVEVDILESFFGNTYLPHNLHFGGYGKNYKFDTTKENKKGCVAEDSIPVDDGFHRFGVLWEEDGYTFFVDGEQSGEKLTSGVSHTEQFILIGTECVGYRSYIPGVYKKTGCDNVYPNDEFVVDYIRVFDKKG